MNSGLPIGRHGKMSVSELVHLADEAILQDQNEQAATLIALVYNFLDAKYAKDADQAEAFGMSRD